MIFRPKQYKKTSYRQIPILAKILQSNKRVYINLVKFIISGRGERCTSLTLVFICLPIILPNILHYREFIFSSRTLIFLPQSVDISDENPCEEIGGLPYNLTKHSALRRINFFIKNFDIAATECWHQWRKSRVKKSVVFPIILPNILHYGELIFSSRTLILLPQSVDISDKNPCEEIGGLPYNIIKHYALWRINYFIKNFGIAATECWHQCR